MSLTLLLSSIAIADPPSPSETASTPIATVLDHRLSVIIEPTKRKTETVTWTVRIDDPEGCSAGLLAPPGLDGASSSGAQVLEDLLVIPSETVKGTVFTLTATKTAPAGAHSGVFYTAPDLPTEHTMLTVSAPMWVPLTVWADPAAVPTYDLAGTRTVTVQWPALRKDELGTAAWSSFIDWPEASAKVSWAVDQKVSDKMGLGRELASDSLGMGLGGITQLVFNTIALDPYKPGSWEQARSAATVANARSGNASERGLVLLSVLRLAGFDARPGYYRPARALGTFPITVPAPTLLPEPLIAVHREEGTVYIDPAAEFAAVPERPASLLGATIWIPGELPTHLPNDGVFDGAITVNTQLSLEPEGGAAWTANLVATGAAQEYLRTLLAPLDAPSRTLALEKLVKQGRSGGTRVTAQVDGVESPDHKLTITVSGHDDQVLTENPSGFSGKVGPVLAPALAAWLPPRLSISEVMSIRPPTTLVVLGAVLDPDTYRAEAIVGRSLRQDGQQIILTTAVERPYRVTTPSIESAAARILAEDAPRGVEILLFGSSLRPTLKALRADARWSSADRAVLVPLFWLGVGNQKKAVQTMADALSVHGQDSVVDTLFRYGDPAALRSWEGLLSVPGFDDRAKMLFAAKQAALPARTVARKLAETLEDSNDAWVRMNALLLLERLLPGDPDIDLAVRSAHADLLDRAAKAAEALGVPEQNRVTLQRAKLAIARDDLATAESLLARLPDSPEVFILRASASSSPIEALRQTARNAVEAHPGDISIISAAASALQRAGDHQEALVLAIEAARLAQHDPDLWALVVPPALGSGDLPTATYAAKKASDLDPDDQNRASQWGILATLMLAREEVDSARLRAGLAGVNAWPPSVDDRMGLDDAAVLAVLEHAEEAVSADPRLLAIRAQMRISGQALDEAARDGLLLATRHATPEGYALAFAATAGRQYSTSLLSKLDEAARTEPTATTTRMEYRLVAGGGDPLVDAWRLRDDPRAKTVLEWSAKPAKAVSMLTGWPAKVSAPKGTAPAGFQQNRVLSALPGVVGWSNPEAASAVVRVGKEASGEEPLLPPPFALLYEVNPQLVESSPDGARVLRLDGGIMPLYAATVITDGSRCWGFGFTAVSAKRALSALTP